MNRLMTHLRRPLEHGAAISFFANLLLSVPALFMQPSAAVALGIMSNHVVQPRRAGAPEMNTEEHA